MKGRSVLHHGELLKSSFMRDDSGKHDLLPAFSTYALQALASLVNERYTTSLILLNIDTKGSTIVVSQLLEAFTQVNRNGRNDDRARVYGNKHVSRCCLALNLSCSHFLVSSQGGGLKMLYQEQRQLNNRDHREKLQILARSVVSDLLTPALKLQVKAELERQAANNRVQLQQEKPMRKELAAAHPELSAKPTAQT